MSNSPSEAPPSPFASILKWSMEWPEWQRDALRRIVARGTLSADDLKELEAICRRKHELAPASGTTPDAVPFGADHIPGGTDGTASVHLVKLSGLQNVGRIPCDQEIFFGAAPGLTVIYGENGAGKSGYARVIKKACRARGTPQHIKPDAFAAAPDGPAKATIVCRVGATDVMVDWTDGSTIDPRLANIFVFDSFSAKVHVGEDAPACFKPRGLDVLPELARACDVIRLELQAEIDAENKKIKDARDSWGRSGTTVVATLINTINASTDPAKVDTAAAFSEADETRLADVIATLSTNPKVKAADTSAAATRIRTFVETAKARAASVDDASMRTICDAIKEADIAAKAAQLAVEPELLDTDLPGSCNDVWRKLWDAAKEYSLAHAYPGKTFPVTDTNARCVLCQQTLQPEAIDRYARFHKFVADETRARADAAKAKVAELKPGVDALRTIGLETAGLKADLDREAAGTFAAVEAFAKAIDTRIAHAQRHLNDGTWADPPVLPATPLADLIALADSLDKRAAEELAAADPEKAKTLAAERDELADKRWLVGKKDDVKAQIARHRHVAMLEKCRNDCTTNVITIKSGELHEAHVTAAFCGAFKEELAALGMNTLPVKLDAAKGTKGERRFGIKFESTASAKVSDIASEGEHRCIALAAFMAELSQASHTSALVFDDPVSSLDHKRRDAIAARLVKEAAHRQVIVFTHDLAFVCDLAFVAKDKLEVHYMHVERVAGRPGRVLPGLVWDAQTYDAQMKTLREQIGKADKIYREKGDSEYRTEAMPVVERIRGACERIIEQHLINGAVKRHDSKILVRSTPGIAVVTAVHWNAVHDVWRACSNLIEGHATPLSGPRNVPDPSALKGWMKTLEDTVEAVKKLRDDLASIAR